MLAIHGGKPTIIDIEKAKFKWPIIDKEVEEAVVKQLYTTVSIYDRSGIIKEFEEKFKAYHGTEHALLTNSGTTAIYSMFVAANFHKDDEVIFPAYNFFASVAPLFFTGATPVFCDAQADGNIDPQKIEALITPNTKAIAITHMWGIPCDMDTIIAICKKHKLLLLEDCSHAHGATYKGKLVGTFGDMAAWSLQGQKIVTGGEGGIMVTNNKDYYYKALLLGHYNKRCRQEIPSDYPLSEFSVTGMGLKLRSHPLAVAMANVYLDRLDKWLIQKRKFAKKFDNAFSKLKGLSVPKMPEGANPSWYGYVLQYNGNELEGLPIQKLVEALHKEGLVEVDIPNSTGPLNLQPLFQNPEPLFPEYKGKLNYTKDDFPKSIQFHSQAIKLPTWVNEEDEKIVDLYIAGFQKVISEYKKLL